MKKETLKKYLFIIGIWLFTVMLFSCDLLNNPTDPDYLQRLYDEIAWARAERLTVSFEYPGTWGQGSILTIAENRRLGYDFDIEFNPQPGFSIADWKAYKTADIQAYRETQGVNWNWVGAADPAGELRKMEEAVEPLVWGEGEDIELRVSFESGRRTFSIRINIVDPITIVPLCNNAPEIIRTYPPMSEELNIFRPTETITIDLSSVVLSETVKLEQGYIEITGQNLLDGVPTGSIEDISDYFGVSWHSGLWRIIIQPTLDGASQIENMKITVRLGQEIKNNLGYSLVGINNDNPTINFSWKTARISTVNVTKLEAEYDEKNDIITVTWALSSAHSARISYIVNNSFRNTLASSNGLNGNIEIENVLPLNVSGVRNGQAVSYIQRYEIWVQLYDAENEVYRDSGSSITIWNFHGMNVNRDNPAELINTAEDFRAVSAGGKIVTDAAGANKNYILMRNITISAHTPISDFRGNFYGNGHTITINSLGGTATDRGLFGVIGTDSIVRDLTVVYETTTGGAVPVIHTDFLNFGGIAGTVQGNAQLINVLASGEVNISGSNGERDTSNINIGGLTGRMTNTSGINNSYAALDLNVIHSGTISFGANGTETGGNSFYIGGITGNIGGTAVRVQQVRAIGNITVGGINNEVIVKRSDGAIGRVGLFVGGLAGRVVGALLEDLEYQRGRISVWCGNGSPYLGGAIGAVVSGGTTTVTRSAALPESFDINKSGSDDYYFFYVGGFIGLFSGGTISYCYSESPVVVNAGDGNKGVGGFVGYLNAVISYCYAKGNISVTSTGNPPTAGSAGSQVTAGGFAGISDSTATNAIQFCFATGNVTVVGGGAFHVGGFLGAGRSDLSDCYSRGNVFVDMTNASVINAGGLIGRFSSGTFTITRSFATGTVTVQRSVNGRTHAGGLAGSFITYSIGNPTDVFATITNSVALGQSVTATGGTAANRHIGRVYGGEFPTDPATAVTLTNNHGFNDMRLYQHDTRGISLFLMTPVLGTNNANGKDGQDANLGTTRFRAFWGNADGSIGLGFNSGTVWDFSTVEDRGHPILRGLGGQ